MLLIIYYTKSSYLLFWVVLNTTVLYEAVDGSWNAAHSLWWATDRSLGVSWQYNVIRGARASWANGKRRHILITRSERKKNRALLWLRLIRKQRERGENKQMIHLSRDSGANWTKDYLVEEYPKKTGQNHKERISTTSWIYTDVYARCYAGHKKHMLSMTKQTWNYCNSSHQVMSKRRRLHDASLTLHRKLIILIIIHHWNIFAPSRLV